MPRYSKLPDVIRAGAELIGPALETAVDHLGRKGEYVRRVNDLITMENNTLFNQWTDVLAPVIKGNKSDIAAAESYIRSLGTTPATDQQKVIAQSMQDFLDLTEIERFSNGPLIKDGDYYRQKNIRPGYFPDRMDHRIRSIMTGNAPRDAKRKAELTDDFVNYYINNNPTASREDALKAMESELSFAGGFRPNQPDASFGPLRKPEGPGLPPSWRTDGRTALLSYAQRGAMDLAYHRHVERNPIMAKMLGLKHDGRGNPTPENVIMDGSGLGHFDTKEPVTNMADDPILSGWHNYMLAGKAGARSTFLDKLGSVSNAGRLGPITALRDFYSATAAMPEIFKLGEFKHLPKALANYLFDPKDFMRKGAQRHYRGTDWWAIDSMTGFMSQLADTLRTYQGRNLLELASRGTLYHMGELVTPGRVAAGDDAFFKLMKIPEWRDVPIEDLKKRVGLKAMQHIQGAYGPEDSPLWILPGAQNKGDASTVLRGTLSLFKWPLGRGNNWMRTMKRSLIDKGDPTPLIKSFTGMWLGAEAYGKIREAFTGNKPMEQTTKELLKTKEDVFYTIAAKAAAMGYAGWIGDSMYRIMQAKFGEKSLNYKYPLFIGLDDVRNRTIQLYEALNEVPDDDIETKIDVLSQYPIEILKDNIQLARLLLKDTPENIGQREQRIYNRIFGAPKGAVGDYAANPFDIKKPFMKAKTIGDAREALPGVEAAFEKTGAVPTVPGALPGVPNKGPGLIPFVAQMQGKEAAGELARNQMAQQGLALQKRALLENMERKQKANQLENVLKGASKLGGL